ncbi:MAG TPA: family 78 glycoside hydrolase catalytic domain [Rhizomicrobium sp.]|nr:family 78 glycoside hydrolase catalytic domain [Rhizomicrobium sp.]
MIVRPSRRGMLAGAGIAGLSVANPSLAASALEDLRILGLMAENVSGPIGVQLAEVRLSWRLETDKRGTLQSAYQVQVASSAGNLRAGNFDLWDSGRIGSDQSFDIVYRGNPLVSRQRAHWQVKVWDNHKRVATSAPAFWEMGLLSPSDWTGKWLAAEDAEMRGDREVGLTWLAGDRPAGKTTRQFRLNFALDADAEATLVTIANSSYRLFIDGSPVALPRHLSIAMGPQGAVSSVVSLKAGKHTLGFSLDDLDSLSISLGAATVNCAAMIRARMADGRVVRIGDSGTRTYADSPANWASVAFDDGAWPLCVPVGTRAAPFPGKGAFLLRRNFETSGQVVSARLYVTALGSHETYINGQKIDDAMLAPEFTDFRKRILYRVHDVSALIREGANAIGAMVGDGWYGSFLSPSGRFSFGDAPLRYLAQLEITYADGRAHTVVTDEQWSLCAAPVTMSEIYDGEEYDARLEQPGWASPNFKEDARWTAVRIAPPATGRLEGMISPPIRRSVTLPAKSIKAAADGYVVDFGQNFAGWVRFSTKGRAGDRISLRFAEVLNSDGSVDQSNLRMARAADFYTLKGDPAGETYEPHFTYHGFRYVQIFGLSGAPGHDDIVGIVVHSDLPETGHLRVDNALIKQLWQNALWSQRSNFFGIPTDCPQRDERLGWMGDANVFWDAAAFNMNVAPFTERWMADVRDAQASNGAYSNVSPNTLDDGGRSGSSPCWSDAGVMLPWIVWKRYGDTAVIDQHWDSMARYIEFIEENNSEFIWLNRRGNDYGDWVSYDGKEPGDPTTPKDLIGTAMWKHSVDALVDMARATGRNEHVARYAALSGKIKSAFLKSFVQADGTVGNDSHTGYILALRFNMLPADLRAASAAKLKANIIRRGNFLTSGFIGTSYSLDALADAGFAETVYDLLLRTQYPSWGYMVIKGATTIWERWNGDTGNVAMNSYNHYALGAVNGFVFRRIAGIDAIEPGFKVFAVNPVLDARVKSGGGDYDSILGRLATDWSQGPNGEFSMKVSVAPNAKARIHLPTMPGATIRESGISITANPDIRLISSDSAATVLEVGSGNYNFAVSAG